MLKRLELVGFKSFADKTRFDFAPGITGVVGPNGSGKSNVVDAVRWILGEQSAKSLRGGEMADVIFNGSSSRRSLGMAEVTVVFDNARRLLSVDAEEVQITRRVYRDGTGEYLINGQMSRLKDIKEIFLGSGAGTGGYTIIAQGRVDELLQASTKDRREIFDEAAGISRFKAKKVEAQRKLLAVEGNLTRSKDRLDGLDGQLRTLRLQAAKAQRHKEYTDRLQVLRVGLGTREYRELTAALEVELRALQDLRTDVSGATARAESLEQAVRELDWQVNTAEEALRHQEGKLADARQQIAGFDASLKHDRGAVAEHEAELLRLGRVRADLGHRLKALEAESAKAAAEVTTADDRLRAEQDKANAAAADLATASGRVADLDRQVQTDRERQYDLVRQAAAARSQATADSAQVERLQKEYTRKLGEIEQKAARCSALESALNSLSQVDADLKARLDSARARLTTLHAEREGVQNAQAQAQRTLEDLRVRQGDLRGRIEVLEALERSFEGIGAGVRDVLGKVGAGSQSALSQVVGLVADLLTVPRDMAPLVELALGDATQRLVVRSPAAVDGIVAAVGDVTGRVGLLPLREHGAGGPLAHLFHTSQSAFLSPRECLASYVQCDHPDLASLPDQLLGTVALVDTLADARRLAAQLPGHRFITRSGTLLEPDGTLTIGPPKAEAGIVSRKSELRELRGQYQLLAAEVSAAEVELAELRRRGEAVDGVIEAVEAEIGLLSGEAGDLRQKIVQQRQQLKHLYEDIELLRGELRTQEEQVRSGEAQWVAAKLEADQAEQAAEDLRVRLNDLNAASLTAEQDRDRCQQAHTEAQVALSRAVAERDRARDKSAQVEAEFRKRKIEAIDQASAFLNVRGRLADSTLAMLRASAGMADAYREKEARERQAVELTARVAAGRSERERIREELQAIRSGWQEKQAAAHARELAAHNLQARREAVASRIREDYGLDLAALDPEPDGEIPMAEEIEEDGVSDSVPVASEAPAEAPPPLPVSPAEAQQEIEELRKKLARLGSVNMEALEELTRVETEFNTLKVQHDDLNAARASLQTVIDTINTDSRKLFTDTLTTVRGYFQEIFRKLFGGGQADIVLEDGVDVLESGIDITARPPGKELRSLSLLSGGEKTLTAIALLLAIFRNKPSPFCLLDEVDAALDEANTQRLASVLREFLEHSQFIVITHKKRTMAAADRLWGVTMQESGVSRLLPMRFEDWTDEEAGTEAAA